MTPQEQRLRKQNRRMRDALRIVYVLSEPGEEPLAEILRECRKTARQALIDVKARYPK